MASMADKHRHGGLGRGLGALIPTAPRPLLAAAEESETSTVPVPLYRIRDVSPTVERPIAPEAFHEDVDEQPTDTGSDPSDELVPIPGAHFAELPISEVHANARQPRQAFDEDALAELTHSVREFGVLQPVVVRADDTGYELVMGERRLRAAAAAGLDTIPAIVRGTADDAMLRDALMENIHRTQLNPLEEAAAYQQLLDEFGVTHDELAQRIGRSRPHVTNTIRLLNLPVPVQRRVAAGVISAGHARALLGFDDSDVQEDLATRIVTEGLSVRATEELVALHQHGHAPSKSPRRSPAARITPPAIDELAEQLSDTFDTRVRVELGRRKGKITVEFASVEDLERIVAVMAPDLATRPHPGSDAANEP
jgi:ParB family transcriptional regulator, chromosome partitioning protein